MSRQRQKAQPFCRLCNVFNKNAVFLKLKVKKCFANREKRRSTVQGLAVADTDTVFTTD
jgi:hypothetical protein